VSAQLASSEASLAQPTPLGGGQDRGDVLFQCLAWVASVHGDERTVTAWRQGVPHDGEVANPQAVVRAAQQAGFVVSLVQRRLPELPSYVLPAIVLLHDSQAAVLIRINADGTVDAAMPESADALIPVQLPMDELAARATGYNILIKPAIRHDERAGAPVARGGSHWFWSALWVYRGYYGNAALAAVMINVLTLAGTFFAMNVYDRVVPTHAYATLWSLAIGTALAMVFEFATRQMRSHLVDVAGKKVDLVLGSLLFRQALSIRLESRPASSGAFAHRLREFESLREFTTSATVSALTDLPFALLFLAVIVVIGGQLAWVPALAIVAVLIASVAVQWPLARHMRENLREAALKQGLLIESLEGIETLKAVNGQSRMQKSWEDYSAVAAQSYMKTRSLSSFAMSFVSFVQQIETVVLIVWGVYLIHQGLLSIGALIGVVMLARQVVAPLGQVVGLAVRYQQARASLTTLDELMKQPTDHDPKQTYLSRERFEGALRTEQLQFTYPNSKLPALANVTLSIEPGERVAILGRIGSGKSTLLRLLSALYLPTEGSVYADGIDLRQIEPADVHHNVGLVAQDCKLFHGTLRDNLTIGIPQVSTERLLRVCRTTGLDTFIARHPNGMDMMLGEGGAGLSGGQRQLVALARSLLPEPPVLLMDEPTSAMDAQTETAFIAQLRQLPGKRTLVIATHRMSLLALVDRVIVLDQGRVIADGPKNQLIQVLTGGSGLPVSAANMPVNPDKASNE
jgi:ATP-binding cassette, subfamily C, bacterial LapB